MNDDNRHSALTGLWQHHNSSQFQWPPIILGTIFVAVSLLVSEVKVDKLATTSNWGVDAEVKYGAACPMILIGLGTLVMLYTMARERKVRDKIEHALSKLDPSFYDLNHPHPQWLSGAKLVWGFMAVVAFAMLVVGYLFLWGFNFYAIVPVGGVTLTVWCALFYYGLADARSNLLRKQSANKAVNRSGESDGV